MDMCTQYMHGHVHSGSYTGMCTQYIHTCTLLYIQNVYSCTYIDMCTLLYSTQYIHVCILLLTVYGHVHSSTHVDMDILVHTVNGLDPCMQKSTVVHMDMCTQFALTCACIVLYYTWTCAHMQFSTHVYAHFQVYCSTHESSMRYTVYEYLHCSTHWHVHCNAHVQYRCSLPRTRQHVSTDVLKTNYHELALRHVYILHNKYRHCTKITLAHIH